MPVPSWAELGLLFNIMISLSCMFCVKYSWFCIIFFGYFKFWQIQGVKNKPFFVTAWMQTNSFEMSAAIPHDRYFSPALWLWVGGLLLRLLTHIFPSLGSVWFTSSQLNEVFPSPAAASSSVTAEQTKSATSDATAIFEQMKRARARQRACAAPCRFFVSLMAHFLD